MIDSHAHLSDSEIKSKVNELLMNFEELGGAAVLNVGHSPKNNIEILNMSRELKNKKIKVLSAIGLHPELFSPISSGVEKHITTFEDTNKALKNYEQLVRDNIDEIDFIGETGLDYYHFFLSPELTVGQKETARELQLHSFRRHCEIALEFSLPLTIHVRAEEGSNRAVEDALSIITEIGKGRLKGSFHSYTSNIDFVDDILAMGFYIGINGIVTYNKADNVKEIARKVPLDRLLLETDAPWLPPHAVRSNKKLEFRKGQPSDIFIIAETVGEVKGISKEKVLESARDNFMELKNGV
jgi:TatD DNase family protein